MGGCVKSHFQVKLSWYVVDLGFENKYVHLCIDVLLSVFLCFRLFACSAFLLHIYFTDLTLECQVGCPKT